MEEIELYAESEVLSVEEKNGAFSIQTDENLYKTNFLFLCIGNQEPHFGKEFDGIKGYFHRAYGINDIISFRCFLHKDR